MAPSVGQKLTLISGVAVGNIIVNPVGTRVVTSLTEDRGSWHATTVKGNIPSGTAKNLLRTRPSIS